MKDEASQRKKKCLSSRERSISWNTGKGDPSVLAIQSPWNACPGGSDQQG